MNTANKKGVLDGVLLSEKKKEIKNIRGTEMKIIMIKTQKEIDDLPINFDEFTIIEIRSKEIIKVYNYYNNSIVYSYDNSKVYAHNNSRVYARSNSIVYSYGNSRVYANSNSRVYAHSNSIVYSYGSSRVYAHSNSIVYSYGSSRVRSYDSSMVNSYNSSIVHSYGNSRINAHHNSRVYAYDNSIVSAYLTSVVYNYSTGSTLNAYDNSTLYLKTKCDNITSQDSVNIIDTFIEPTFDEWLERGIVYADNIFRELKSIKIIGDKTIYNTNDGFVARKGDKYSHGETIEKAINDLKYKISDRDKSEFNYLKLDTELTLEIAIEAYRTITGACEMGVREFIESRNDIGDTIIVNEIIDITVGKYGHDEFKKFIEKGE